MDRHRVRQLAARFIAEAEADINYGLAEGLDPRHEYAVLVARLHGEEILQPQRSSELVEVENGASPDYDPALIDGPEFSESAEVQQLVESRTGL